ncbi:MAG: YheT family hydrolase [Candidatus Competibacterales bacterium]
MPLRRERLVTHDGDELLLDHLPGPKRSPRVVVLHGLEGSAYATHVQGLLARIKACGWRATVVNFRSCARDPQRLSRRLPNSRPRLYHAGDTVDFDTAVRFLMNKEPETRLLGVGFSLGGNVLLKWLGEGPVPVAFKAAVAIAAPFDLGACADHMALPAARFYSRYFLATLKGKVTELVARFPELARVVSIERVNRAKTLRRFDDLATAPLHGFFNAADYYRRASALGFLHRIQTPTLCLNAYDDPFIPPGVLARVERRVQRSTPALGVHFTRCGGHVGFVGGQFPWAAHYWAEATAVDWLQGQLARDNSRAFLQSLLADEETRGPQSRAPGSGSHSAGSRRVSTAPGSVG